MAKKRFCGYRNITFWLNPGIKKRQRVPLPACVYAFIQVKFPPTTDGDLNCTYNFTKYKDLY